MNELFNKVAYSTNIAHIKYIKLYAKIPEILILA
jgi:hypothetical protein